MKSGDNISIEGKYTVNRNDSVVLPILNSLCLRDPDHPVDRVNSLYFDTPDLQLLGQKVDSDFLKFKVRMRWYGEPVTNTESVKVFLEVKRKQGVQRFKSRTPFHARAESLVPGVESFEDFAHLAGTVQDLGILRFDSLFPMIVIRYYRYRFYEPISASRISLDTAIGYSGINKVFFPASRPRQLNHSVLEIKSRTGDIPKGLSILKSRVNMRDSFSKYEECWNMFADTSYRRELTSSRHS